MTFKDVVNSFFSSELLSDLSAEKVFLSLIVTLFLSLWIFIIYRKYVQNEFYSKNFNISLALIPTITTSIILAMQSNLVISLGMVGALSIVRYRTALKNPLDLFFMFWAISVGIVCGAGQYVLATLMSLLVTILFFILFQFDFLNTLHIGIIRCAHPQDLDMAEKDFKKICSFFKVKSKQMNSEFGEMIFEYKLRKKVDLTAFLKEKEYIKDFQMLSNN